MDEPHDSTNTAPTSPALPAIPPVMTPVDPPGHGSKKPGRGSGVGRALAVGATMVVLGFGGGVAGFWAADEFDWIDGAGSSSAPITPVQPTNDSSSTERVSDSDSSPRSIYEQTSPAVVHIGARVVQQGSFFGIPTTPQESQGTGSGFLIDDEGHIVTNAHVVEDANELTVAFGDEKTVKATVVGEDKSSDIAVLKIDPEAVKDIEGGVKFLEFGDPSKLRVGDPVVAIGNPFNLDRTLTTGVVSALQRNIPSLNDFSISDVIQTDAAVNPGNSGGPLLNMDGEVIGVNSQIESRGGGFDGIAFAVPSSTVERVANQLIKSGEIEYAWLGVQGESLTDELRTARKLDDDQEGVHIVAITPKSPALRAGLKGDSRENANDGDIVLSFDGKELESMQQLASAVDGTKPGDKVKVEVLRNGKQQTLTVTLAERPDEISGGSSSRRD